MKYESGGKCDVCKHMIEKEFIKSLHFGTSSKIHGQLSHDQLSSQDENGNVDFIDDNGDQWQEYSVYHKGFSDWLGTHRSPDVQDNFTIAKEEPFGPLVPLLTFKDTDEVVERAFDYLQH